MVAFTQISQVASGLTVVICLMFIIAYVLKRVKAVNCLGGKEVAVISNLPLGNKERIMLLETAGQRVLVGMTAHTMQTLLVISKNKSQPSKNNTKDVVCFDKLIKEEQEAASEK